MNIFLAIPNCICLPSYLISIICYLIFLLDSLSTLENWYVLVDAASYIATNPLDLSAYHPDFVPISFYKLFGYPTGLG